MESSFCNIGALCILPHWIIVYYEGFFELHEQRKVVVFGHNMKISDCWACLIVGGFKRKSFWSTKRIPSIEGINYSTFEAFF